MRSSLYNWHDHLTRRTTRREFLAIACLGGPLLGARPFASGARGLSRAAAEQPREQDIWETADAIVARIAPPRFPDRTFDITRFGATRTDDATEAFRAAIDACARAGGGRVTVPKGRFETGAIRLRSRVRLHLEDGARLRTVAVRVATSRSS